MGATELKQGTVEVIWGYYIWKSTYFFILASGGRLTHSFIKKNVKVANKWVSSIKRKLIVTFSCQKAGTVKVEASGTQMFAADPGGSTLFLPSLDRCRLGTPRFGDELSSHHQSLKSSRVPSFPTSNFEAKIFICCRCHGHCYHGINGHFGSTKNFN